HAGLGSRRAGEEMVLAGRVAVNGIVVSELGARADPDVDEVTLDGVPVVRSRYRYFALNKPVGVISAASDDRGRETVVDLVPIADVHLYPVGRLDLESEGLLILTNDGHLTKLLTHPSHEVEKEYLVGLDGPLAERDVQRLVRGVESEGERLRASSVRPASPPEAEMGGDEPVAAGWALVTLKEGRKREIRRMMAAVGRRALVLRRVRIGPVFLGAMGTGSFRELTDEEVSALYAAARPGAAAPVDGAGG
ncbi:MAG: pseudouridine synthase, partial [Dehalococcoidia bacterium]